MDTVGGIITTGDSGKYKEGKMLGVWKYYNEKGVFIEQKTFN